MLDMNELLESNTKLVEQFGAQKLTNLTLPDFYTFRNGLFYSHRDFDKFLKALNKGEKCAIVSGFNASGTIHLGHKPVFDTNLFFQKEFGLPVFIPISDDESYVTGKVDSQEKALENAMNLAKELIAYGFDPKNTYFIIDQIYTNIYNIAIKLSKKLTMSEIIATYGYKKEDNPGMYFYPTIQSAHILFPQEKFNIKNVLVIIGPDEDSHIRISRDLAASFNLTKPSILHSRFLPGLDGTKMSKSKNNAIFLNDDEKTIRKKVGKAISGGAKTVEEHRKTGGDPSKDMACTYLHDLFLNETKSEQLFKQYREGKLLSGEVKEQLIQELVRFTEQFRERLQKVSNETVQKCILRNDSKVDLS